MNTEVLISGAGPTGLTLAAELAKYGVPFRIIDIGRGPTDLSKAVGVQSRTLEMFDVMGIADELIACGNRATSFTICDDDKQLISLDFSGIGNRFPFLLAVPQSETERVLMKHLESLGGTVERTTELVSFDRAKDSVVAQIKHENGETEQINARFLVGSDGAHSTVRRGIGLPFEGEEYPDQFLLADVYVEAPQMKHTDLFLFLHDGSLAAFFGLPGGHWRMIADFRPNETPEGSETSDEPTLTVCQKIADERCPFPVKLSDMRWSSYYRIHRRIVPRLSDGNVFLAGDSAHIHSPAAAQGMNTGIQDAINLAWKLAYVSRGQADQSLLDTYNSERYPVEKGVLALADTLLKIASIRQPLARGIRDALMPLIGHTKLFQETMRDRISELAIAYEGSRVVVESAPGVQGPNAGERAPDATAELDGKPTRLYELLRNGMANLLVFEEVESDEAIDLAELTVSPDVAGQFIVSTADQTTEAPSGFQRLVDTDGELRARYCQNQACGYLIRPDGYIGVRATPGQLQSALSRWLEMPDK